MHGISEKTMLDLHLERLSGTLTGPCWQRILTSEPLYS